MLFQRINRTDPEKVFVIVKNVWSTASLSNGQCVAWDYVTEADGISVTKCSASANGLGAQFGGIITQTIADDDYGLMQVYGHHTAIRARTTTGGAPAIAKGTGLAPPLTALFCMESVPVTGTKANCMVYGIAGAANATYTTAAIAGFIRAM